MGPGVLLAHVVAVVGGHHAQAVLAGELLEDLVDLLLLGEAVVLDLNEKAVAEDGEVLVEAGLGQVQAVLEDELGDLRPQAPGEGDEALGMLPQDLPVNPGLFVKTFQVGPRGQAYQVLVAGEVLGEKGEVEVAAV